MKPNKELLQRACRAQGRPGRDTTARDEPSGSVHCESQVDREKEAGQHEVSRGVTAKRGAVDEQSLDLANVEGTIFQLGFFLLFPAVVDRGGGFSKVLIKVIPGFLLYFLNVPLLHQQKI